MIKAVAFALLATPTLAQDSGDKPLHPQFTITAPDHLVLETLQNGYRLHDGRMIRNPLFLTIVMDQPAEHTALPPYSLKKRVAGFDQPFTYRIVESAGGSGGNTFTLTASGQDNIGLPLHMSAQLQSEWGTPTFKEAWEILETYRPR